MTNLLQGWIFINYCGQKIGQFNSKNINNSLINALVSQVAPISFVPLFYIYIMLGFRSFWMIFVLVIFQTFLVSFLIKKSTMGMINIANLENQYKSLARGKRIRNFILAIIITGLSIVCFACSLAFL